MLVLLTVKCKQKCSPHKKIVFFSLCQEGLLMATQTHFFKPRTKGGGVVSPQSHEMLCVRLAKLARVSREILCVRIGSTRAGEQRSREGDITLQITLAVSQACMFQIFTKNLLFILVKFFSDLCF